MMCNYGTLTLLSLKNFNSYLWNTNVKKPSILISRPGTYWLEVKDNNQCTGRDSIIVGSKECLRGLYVPSGFTLNNEGQNDQLKPFLGGTIKQYDFKIYNRWGQIVFATKEVNTAWDGKFKGMTQDGNVFAWMCNYQLEGESMKLEKGAFILIR